LSEEGIRQLQARPDDSEFFEALVKRRLDSTYRLCLAITNDRDDAADATQAAFASAWRHLGDLRDRDRVDPWLQRIAVNSCRMVLRSRRRRGLREIPMTDGLALTGTPDRALSDGAALSEALKGLAIDSRAVLALHYAHGQAVSEIASTLGISVAAAKSRLFRARDALRKALEDGDDDAR
jgi:RNA polymerase sigma-70 factor, ECF subfamily